MDTKYNVRLFSPALGDEYEGWITFNKLLESHNHLARDLYETEQKIKQGESRIVGLVSPLTGNMYTSRMDFEALLSTNNTHAGALYKAGQKIRKLKLERQKEGRTVELVDPKDGQKYKVAITYGELLQCRNELATKLFETKPRKEKRWVELLKPDGNRGSYFVDFDMLLREYEDVVKELHERILSGGRQRLYGVDLIRVDKGTPFGSQVNFDMLLTDRNALATKLHAANSELELTKAELEAAKAELAKPRIAFEWETIIKTIKESDEHVYKLGHADGNVRFCIIPHAHNYTPRYLLDPESCAYTKIPYIGGYPQSSQGIVYVRDNLANDIMSRLVQVTRQPK